MKRLNLIDGYGYVFRAFYALPPLINNRGVSIGAVYGFCRMMIKFMKQRPDELFLAVFDTGEDNYRHQIYANYKSQRPEVPEDLKKQFPLIREACRALGISQIEENGYEADDLIASYALAASQKGYEVNIISGDKDFMQLLFDPHIKIFHPIKEQELTNDDVIKKFGVPPEQVVDVQAIMGDSSDNIPGVPGIGPKGAKELITQFGNLEGVYAHLEDLPKSKRKEMLRENKEKAFMSKQLAALKNDIPLKHTLSELSLKDINVHFLEDNGFKSLITLIDKRNKPTEERENLALDVFLQKALNSLEIYVRIPKDLSKESITCHVGHHQMVYENDIFHFLKDFKDVLENPGIVKIFHAIKDIIYHCQKLNIHFQGYHCLESMSLCLFSGKYDHSLEALENHYGTENLYPLMKNDLIESGTMDLYERAERFLPEILVMMEKYGVQVDKPYLEKFQKEVEIRLIQLEKDIYKEANTEFNINSPQQLGFILFEKLGMPTSEKTKTGHYVTDSDVLENLASLGFTLPKLILEYRQWSKIQNTYIMPLIEKSVEGRIHTTFLHNTVLTGRLSSKNPNLQNIPIKTEESREIRRAFVAPQGSKILSFDYSQIELRLAAHFAKETHLIEAFQKGEDIHAATAQALFKEVTKEKRRHAKVVNFGILYGMGPHGLAQNLGISRTEAAHIITQYFEQYPKIKEYIEFKKHEAKTKGYVTTLFNKRIYIQNIQGKFVGFAERQSVNAPLQGSSADMIKMAMTRIYHWLQDENLQTKMVLQVHDELLFESPDHEVERVIPKIRLMMETVCHLDVPIVVNESKGHSWLSLS